MAGSGKAITVNEDEIAKAATLLGTNKEDEHDYDEQADHLSSVPASARGGFAMAGSGKAITVNEDEIVKAAEMLDTNDSRLIMMEADAGKSTNKVRFSLDGSHSVIPKQ